MRPVATLLFALSVIAFLASVGLYRDAHRTEAFVALLASTILFSAAAVVAAIGSLAKELAKELAKRLPRTGMEKMMESYERSKEQGGT